MCGAGLFLARTNNFMGGISNKVLGTAFERRACEDLKRNGFWVHFIDPNGAGAQPFDIIAVKDGKAFAIECKTLADSRKSFPISRLEENQISAFERWIACGNGDPIILVEHKGKTIVVSYQDLKQNGSVKVE